MSIKKSELQNEIEALKEQLQDLTKTVNIQQEKIKILRLSKRMEQQFLHR